MNSAYDYVRAPPRRILAISVALVVSCAGGGGGEEDAGFTYDGRCGPYANVQLFRPSSITPIVTNAKGLHCTLVGGRPPSGMQLDPSTCVIAGTPLQIESSTVQVSVTASNVSGSTGGFCEIDVIGPALYYGDSFDGIAPHLPGDVFSVSPIAARVWTPGAGESVVYDISPDVAPGSLPPGLTVDPATGRISGTLTWDPPWPSDWWQWIVRVAASGPLGTAESSTYGSLWMRLPRMDYGSSYPRMGTVGTPMAIGAPTIYPPLTEPGLTFQYSLDAWSNFEARLPVGLTLDPATGEISGTPTAPDDVDVGVALTVIRNGVPFRLRSYLTIVVSAAP